MIAPKANPDGIEGNLRVIAIGKGEYERIGKLMLGSWGRYPKARCAAPNGGIEPNDEIHARRSEGPLEPIVTDAAGRMNVCTARQFVMISNSSQHR